MNPLRQMHFVYVAGMMAGIALAAVLMMNEVCESLYICYSPSQIVDGEAPPDVFIQAAGVVQFGSVKRLLDSLSVEFVIADAGHSVIVTYRGILPDDVLEGTSIVAFGKVNAEGIVIADEVSASRDTKE